MNNYLQKFSIKNNNNFIILFLHFYNINQILRNLLLYIIYYNLIIIKSRYII